MATFKTVVNHYRKNDGTYRVYIRITHKREQRHIATPFYVTSDKITRTFKLKDQYILDKCEDKIRELRDELSRLGFLAEEMEIDHLVKALTERRDNIDFMKFWEELIEAKMKEGRTGTANVYKAGMSAFRKFVGNGPVYFSKMTSALINDYYKSLSGLKPNTIREYLLTLQTAYKRAQDRYNNYDSDIVIVRPGIFNGITMPTKERSKANVMKSVAEMQKLIDAPYEGVWSYDFAKDMFVLSFVCFGTNIADFIRMEKNQYDGELLCYMRKKVEVTSKDDAEMKIKVSEVAKIILNKYSGDKKYLIDFRGHARNQRFTRYIHFWFQQIGIEEETKRDDIGVKRTGRTFYANRHTMASFARNECKVEYMTVHEMLNHAVPSTFKTTDVYISKDFSSIWEANDKLLGLFDWSFYLNQAEQEKS